MVLRKAKWISKNFQALQIKYLQFFLALSASESNEIVWHNIYLKAFRTFASPYLNIYLFGIQVCLMLRNWKNHFAFCETFYRTWLKVQSYRCRWLKVKFWSSKLKNKTISSTYPIAKKYVHSRVRKSHSKKGDMKISLLLTISNGEIDKFEIGVLLKKSIAWPSTTAAFRNRGYQIENYPLFIQIAIRDLKDAIKRARRDNDEVISGLIWSTYPAGRCGTR